LVKKRYLFFDFYLVDLHICLEYDGIQHFKPISKFGGEMSFQNVRINDKLKDEYCKSNNIRLIRIPYTSIKNINSILNKEIR
jgi:very-short-patch-repair endonuclease